jgi:hypothetical protein
MPLPTWNGKRAGTVGDPPLPEMRPHVSVRDRTYGSVHPTHRSARRSLLLIVRFSPPPRDCLSMRKVFNFNCPIVSVKIYGVAGGFLRAEPMDAHLCTGLPYRTPHPDSVIWQHGQRTESIVTAHYPWDPSSTRALKRKALIKRMTVAFNSVDDDGRASVVLPTRLRNPCD